jgi:hypothetical protein
MRNGALLGELLRERRCTNRSQGLSPVESDDDDEAFGNVGDSGNEDKEDEENDDDDVEANEDEDELDGNDELS